jgi:hypothetical protein
MPGDPWVGALVGALAINAVLGFAYRLFRLARGGPLGDVVGQALLGVLLGGLAALVATGVAWSRWVSLAYGLLFGLAVMPLWTVAVLIPLRPGGLDIGFTLLYWASLVVIVISALAI